MFILMICKTKHIRVTIKENKIKEKEEKIRLKNEKQEELKRKEEAKRLEEERIANEQHNHYSHYTNLKNQFQYFLCIRRHFLNKIFLHSIPSSQEKLA